MYPPLSDDLRAHREWFLSFVDLPDGGTAVDLGCGNGDDLLLLADRHAGRAVRFVGIDATPDVAAYMARSAGDPRISLVRHRLGVSIPLTDASVDAVYSHNLLECLEDRAGFAREVARILKPGGVAVMAHWDFDSQVLDAGDKDAVRRLVHAYADWKQPWMERADGWMGRRLWGTFAPLGLFDGVVHARVMVNTTYAEPWYGHARVRDFERLAGKGVLAREDVRRVLEDVEALAREGRYFYSITGYAYVGRRVGS